MRTRRAPLLVGALAAVALVAGVGAYLAVRPGGGTPNLLPVSASAPAGTAPHTFTPTGLGASITVPAQWASEPPASGFQYVISSGSPTGAFVLASRRGGVVPVSAATLQRDRVAQLKQIGASVGSVTTGTVDHRPAVRIRYVLPSPRGAVTDTEYNIVAPSTTLPVGAAQHQTVYNWITIAIGTPVSYPDPALVDWISSTIKVSS